MKVIFKLFLLFSFLCSANECVANDRVIIFYDSTKQRLTNLPKNIFHQSFDLGISGKIEAEMNKRLEMFSSKVTKSEILQGFSSNKEVKNLVEKLKESYSYLEGVSKYKVTKIPAVILDTKDGDYIVYGETNIQKALQSIAIYRRFNSN